MLDELRDRVVTYLSGQRVCVIATHGSAGAWAVVVPYAHTGLELICPMPPWSDALFHIEQDPRVVVIVLDPEPSPLRWLQYRGVARIVDSTDSRAVVLRITPERIDLIDERRGWGARETLEI